MLASWPPKERAVFLARHLDAASERMFALCPAYAAREGGVMTTEEKVEVLFKGQLMLWKLQGVLFFVLVLIAIKAFA